METATPLPAPPPCSPASPPTSSRARSSNPPLPSSAHGNGEGEAESEEVKIDILLEDPATGELFASAPYTHVSAVEAVLDSSRFFAIRVVGEGGRKAVLGIGFEERSEAFDFNIALGEVRKILGIGMGMEAQGQGQGVGQTQGSGGVVRRRGGEGRRGEGGGRAGGGQGIAGKQGKQEEGKRDWSLKEGQTIHVDIGRRKPPTSAHPAGAGQKPGAFGWIEPPSAGLSTHSVLPPPPSTKRETIFSPLLPPPPSARDVRDENRKAEEAKKAEMQDLGFDDGEFGEFQ